MKTLLKFNIQNIIKLLSIQPLEEATMVLIQVMDCKGEWQNIGFVKNYDNAKEYLRIRFSNKHTKRFLYQAGPDAVIDAVWLPRYPDISFDQLEETKRIKSVSEKRRIVFELPRELIPNNDGLFSSVNVYQIIEADILSPQELWKQTLIQRARSYYQAGQRSNVGPFSLYYGTTIKLSTRLSFSALLV